MSRRREPSLSHWSFLVPAVIAIVAIAALFAPNDWRGVAREASAGVFRFDIDDKHQCSAFCVRTGVLLTAAHCDGSKFTLKDGRRAFAVAKNVQHDILALITLPKATDRVLFLDDEEPVTGAPVALLGFPYDFPQVYLRTGVVALPADTDDQMALDLGIAPGDSGSPILAPNGRVVGLSISHFFSFGSAAHIAYAVRLAHLRAFVETLR